MTLPIARFTPAKSLELKATLDRLYASFNYADSAVDPIQIVRRFSEPADQEIVGFCAAAVAFGRVSSVLQSIERLLAVMGPRPAAFVRAFDPRRHGKPLASMVHRWTRGADFTALLWLLRQMCDRAGTIEGFFVDGHPPSAADVGSAIGSFSRRALALDLEAAYGNVPKRPGVGYFFPQPEKGSACKRMNLFLRWMVRRDALDLGVWAHISPRQLVVPLDTHIIRVGRCLRLTRRVSPGWAMAHEITSSLRQLDPDDPVKYDFALCHLGMMNGCGFGSPRGDRDCPLRGCCRPARERKAGKTLASRERT